MPGDAPKLQPTTPSNNSCAEQDALLLESAWNLVHEFASTDKYTLPELNRHSPTQFSLVQQLQTAETMNHMFDPTPTFEEMVNPIAEEYDEDLEEMPTDEKIITGVKNDIAVENREIIVIDDDEEEEGKKEQTLITTMEEFELI